MRTIEQGHSGVNCTRLPITNERRSSRRPGVRQDSRVRCGYNVSDPQSKLVAVPRQEKGSIKTMTLPARSIDHDKNLKDDLGQLLSFNSALERWS